LELDKKKYTKQEVSLLVDKLEKEFENKFFDYRNRIKELVKENNDLKTQLESYIEKEQLILSTLYSAEKNLAETEKKTDALYDLEVERLKRFSESWDAYFKDLKEKYPLYPTTKRAISINDQVVDQTKKRVKSKDIINEVEKMIIDDTQNVRLSEKSNKKAKETKFDPKSKIKDYIAATGDNGFNMDDVLHPGALKLEDICKELGLIEENE